MDGKVLLPLTSRSLWRCQPRSCSKGHFCHHPPQPCTWRLTILFGVAGHVSRVPVCILSSREIAFCAFLPVIRLGCRSSGSLGGCHLSSRQSSPLSTKLLVMTCLQSGVPIAVEKPAGASHPPFYGRGRSFRRALTGFECHLADTSLRGRSFIVV